MKWEGGGERDVRKRKRKMKGIETFPTVISKALETDMTIHNKRVPQSQNIYHYATETQFLTFENTNLLFSVFITLAQNFWVWVMKTTLGNQAKQQNLWVPRFLITQLWVLSDMIQNCSKPNRLWVLDEFFAFQNTIFLRKHVLKCYHTPDLFF